MINPVAIRNAFKNFKDRYFRAVQTDTLLGECDNDSDKFYSLEKKAKQFWKEAEQAEKDFFVILSPPIMIFTGEPE